MTDLSDRDRAILDFERTHWNFPGAKEEAVRETFGMSATRYYQRLVALARDPAALAFAPDVVRRVQRRSRAASG